MVEHNVWMETKNAKMKITGENVGLQMVKKTCARLAMDDEPAKNELESFPELTMENAHKISTHQAFLILYRQRWEALFELFK